MCRDCEIGGHAGPAIQRAGVPSRRGDRVFGFGHPIPSLASCKKEKDIFPRLVQILIRIWYNIIEGGERTPSLFQGAK